MQNGVPQTAKRTARVSRTTLTLICPGYETSRSTARAIRVVVTHGHLDHDGNCFDVVSRSGAELWAHDPNGINQVGCVYTAQGFEFDYIGVIFGRDLGYDLDKQTWVGRPDELADSVVKRSKGQFLELVKNVYRVLLSRGLKGCYVYFMDKDTERFFKSRLELNEVAETRNAQS